MQDMGCRLAQFLSIFLFHIFLCSGSSVSGKPPPQEINQKPKQSIRMLFAPSISTTILDGVPIVNPTTPGTTPNPTSPSIEPITNPTTPTSPDTNPTPTLPDTNPTPTLPDTNPAPTGPTTTPPTGPTMTPPTGTTTTPPTGTTTSPGTSGGSWCVANQGASPIFFLLNMRTQWESTLQQDTTNHHVSTKYYHHGSTLWHDPANIYWNRWRHGFRTDRTPELSHLCVIPILANRRDDKSGVVVHHCKQTQQSLRINNEMSISEA